MSLTISGALVYVDRRRLFDVLPENVKETWKKWEVQILILLSLFFQIVLIVLGYKRKYMAKKTRIRFLIWASYLLANWVATVALGVISQDTLDQECPREKLDEAAAMNELMSFWAPFLLLHLGGPDTITAYALEDNELWLRHLVGLIIQTSLALYILIVALPGTSWLPILSIPIFCAGLIKFVERTLALRSANTDYLRHSMLTSPDPGPDYAKFMEEFTLKKAVGFYVEADEVREHPVPIDSRNSYPADPQMLIIVAYDRFERFKRLFVDLILSFQDRDSSKSYFQPLTSTEAFNVIEVELSFAFDMFYTKVPVVYTVAGCVSRLITFSCTFMAFIAFTLLCERDKYLITNLVLTYLLLAGAMALEIYSMIIQLKSDWTVYWLHKHEKLRKCLRFVHYPSRRRWSNSIAQYNFLSFCLDEKPAVCYKVQELLGIAEIREKHRYKTYQDVSPYLKAMIFDQLNEFSKNRSQPGPPVLLTRRDSSTLYTLFPEGKDIEWKDIEFDQSLLMWHISTNLCHCWDSDLDHETNQKRTGSIYLSDYMLYLLVHHPFMLPVGIGLIRFRDTCAEAKKFFKERKLGNVRKEACQALNQVNTEVPPVVKAEAKKFFKERKLGNVRKEACQALNQVNTEVPPVKVKGDRSKSVLFDACRLAKKLQTREPDQKWCLISQVWVDMLAYAATRCRGNHHARQLHKGGELLTHVWLLMAHLGITEQFQIDHGHARAKLVVK